jgi:hypothetical protein
MNEFDPEQFEAELKTLRPASPPPLMLEHLEEKLPFRSRGLARYLLWRSVRREPGHWRWFTAAAGATAAVFLLFVLANDRPVSPDNRPRFTASRSGFKADKVEIDRQLIANFDAVARLPSGEPIRFRCEQWTEKVRLRDSGAGLVLEQTSPRLQIVPVSLEVY